MAAHVLGCKASTVRCHWVLDPLFLRFSAGGGAGRETASGPDWLARESVWNCRKMELYIWKSERGTWNEKVWTAIRCFALMHSICGTAGRLQELIHGGRQQYELQSGF